MKKGGYVVVLIIAILLLIAIWMPAGFWTNVFSKMTGNVIVNSGDSAGITGEVIGITGNVVGGSCFYKVGVSGGTGTSGVVGLTYTTSAGNVYTDPRFLCLDSQFYDCGWELSSSAIVKVKNGQVVGGKVCAITSSSSGYWNTPCTDSTWTPSDLTKYCSNQTVVQTSNCRNTRSVRGTLNCSVVSPGVITPASSFCNELDDGVSFVGVPDSFSETNDLNSPDGLKVTSSTSATLKVNNEQKTISIGVKYYYSSVGLNVTILSINFSTINSLSNSIRYQTQGTFYDSCNSEGVEKYSCANGEPEFNQYVCENGCSNAQCIEDTNTTVTNSTTNNQTQTNTTVSCSDSDGGLNYYVNGITSGKVSNIIGVPDTTQIYNFSDYCIYGNGFDLKEFYCNSNGLVSFNTVPCSNGCSNGVCLVSNSTTNQTNTTASCTDSDGGLNFNLFGSVTVKYNNEIFSNSDLCFNAIYCKVTAINASGTFSSQVSECSNPVDGLSPLIGECYVCGQDDESLACSGADCFVKEAYCKYDDSGVLIDGDADEYAKCADGCQKGACIVNTTVPVNCTVNYECTTQPTVCPSSGRQTKTCVDKGCNKPSYAEEVSCDPGQCTGCYLSRWFNLGPDNKCIPYGFRFIDAKGEKGKVYESDVNNEGPDSPLRLTINPEGTAKLEVVNGSYEGRIKIEVYGYGTYDLSLGESFIVNPQTTYKGKFTETTDSGNVRTQEEVSITTEGINYLPDGKSFMSIIMTENYPAYCDIDGYVYRQKSNQYNGEWAKCQNNYECESNICSYGECVDVKGMFDQINAFKGTFVKVICKLSNMFSIDQYNTCTYNYLGDSTSSTSVKKN